MDTFLTIMLVFLGLVLLMLLISLYLELVSWWKMDGWTVTEGVIIESYEGGDSEGSWAEIQTKYIVNDKEYTHWGIYPRTTEGVPNFLYFFAKKVKKALEKYPEGKIVNIFYNPKKPEQSALERKFPTLILLATLLLLFIVIDMLNF